MTKGHVIANINLIAGTTYSGWQIGITNDPAARKFEWAKTKDVSHWRAWQLDSLSDAQAIESYFINDEGMKGGTGGSTSPFGPVYVYIF